VSFTKGCYTGQELVARIDSRGSNVPRHLRRLDVGGPVAVGDEVTVDGRPVGVVTSATAGPDGRWVALAYIRRGVDVPARAGVGAAATPAAVAAVPE
jgi:folate-binding Fe-S cluster repair protein YgfZ